MHEFTGKMKFCASEVESVLEELEHWRSRGVFCTVSQSTYGLKSKVSTVSHTVIGKISSIGFKIGVKNMRRLMKRAMSLIN